MNLVFLSFVERNNNNANNEKNGSSVFTPCCLAIIQIQDFMKQWPLYSCPVGSWPV